MEGTCYYCGSGTSMLDIVHDSDAGAIKVCRECKEERELGR